MRTLIGLLASFGVALAAATPLEITQQRRIYQQALDHLTAGRTSQFRAARTALDDYVLAPYLDYYHIKTRLASVSDAAMAEFQARHGDLPAAGILHHRWLEHLGARRQWQRLIDNYRPSADAKLRCYYRRALLAQGRREEALAPVAELWTVAHSQPKACDPLFAVWIEAGGVTEALAWQRLQLALRAGEGRLGRYLLRFFAGGELEPWARALYDVHVRPAGVARPGTHTTDNRYARTVIRHGLERLAWRDAAAAAAAWQRFQDSHDFEAADGQAITEAILLAGAREGRFPEHRLTGLSAAFAAAMAEAAVRAERWQDVMFYIGQLPPEARDDLRWQYWQARALESTGLGVEAARLGYRGVALERHYYGFLAAGRLGAGPRLNGAAVEVDRDRLAAVEALPAVARALELYAVGDLINARREWFALIRELDAADQLHAALLAQEIGWVAQSIVTANLAELHDNLSLRFPLAFTDVFERLSETTAVPKPFLLAVARQESAFDPRARSPANARGLMQLMHPTARMVAGRLGVSAPSVTDLYDPDTSVTLGAHHLARLLERYDRRRPLAAAAYNAGEHRVDRWARNSDGMAMDVWIERIPFRETRDYVKNVLAFNQVYGQLLGQPVPMLDRHETRL